MEQAEVSDFHAASWQDVLEEPAEKLDDVTSEGSGTIGARFSVREGNDAVLEAEDSAVGNGDLEDVRGEVLEGSGGSRVGLAVDVPRGVPDLRIDALETLGFGHLLFENGTVDGRQGFDRDREVDS